VELDRYVENKQLIIVCLRFISNTISGNNMTETCLQGLELGLGLGLEQLGYWPGQLVFLSLKFYGSNLQYLHQTTNTTRHKYWRYWL